MVLDIHVDFWSRANRRWRTFAAKNCVIVDLTNPNDKESFEFHNFLATV